MLIAFYYSCAALKHLSFALSKIKTSLSKRSFNDKLDGIGDSMTTEYNRLWKIKIQK